MAADSEPTPAYSGPATSIAHSGAASSTVARTWDLRRRAEKYPPWTRPVVGMLVAFGFTVIANPELSPGGLPTVLAGYGVIVAAAVILGVIAFRRASFRGHSGNVTVLGHSHRPWWRSHQVATPAVFSLVFGGRVIGAFDHWPTVLGCAVIVGATVAWALPRYETADHINGNRLHNPPALTANAAASLADGSLPPDVLELLVLQHHTGERRVSWCATLLGTNPADIRNRIARGRHWLELPATEVHNPGTANWVRLTADGRKALGYI